VLATPGWALGLFPEGTRSQDGELRSLKKGVAYFAQRSQCPVLPVGLARSAQSGTKPAVRFVLGAPLNLQPGEALDAFAERLQEAMGALVKTAQAQL
jgi:1-acyl-sn-glycerol-3-phosphate acyltransferase